MTSIGRMLVFAGATTLLVNCGGGSSNSTPATSPGGGGGGATTTATLTVRYPAGFHQATIVSSQQQQQQRAHRSPAYLNPSPGPYAGQIDIFVDGVDVLTAVPNPNASTDGTQSFAVPLFASGTHQIVAVETENGYNSGTETILAIGETDQRTGLIGGTTSLNLTMQENVQYIGLMSSPTDAHGDALAYNYSSTSNPPVYTSINECILALGDTFTVYPFAADPTGGFATNNNEVAYGAGGSQLPELTGYTNPQTYGDLTNFDTVSGLTNGYPGYTITFLADPATAQIYGTQLHFSVANPAATIYQDALTYENEPGDGAYPGIEHLYNATTHILPLGSLSETNPFVTTIQVNPATGGC